MSNTKEFIKNITPGLIARIYRSVKNRRSVGKWESEGCPLPPPHMVKQHTITDYQRQFKYKLFIETGTYLGDMVDVQRLFFKHIVSIEISDSLYQQARQRFAGRQNIKIIRGDSAEVLPEVMKSVNQPAIFWLDGHYSGGITSMGAKQCPIFEELKAIFDSRPLRHVLLIDDARCFDGSNDYPTIQELCDFFQAHRQHYKITVKHDIIRCVPE